MRFWLGVLVTLIVLVAAGLGVVWTGAYNIAATDEHFDPLRWAFHTTMHNSVEARAEASAPDSFSEEQVRDGFGAYESTCAMCHGAPGVERKAFAKGLRPSPPELAEAAREWAPHELFWIVKHGVKMSGMPALGPTHEDEHIWSIVAFLQRLPEMDAAAYAEMRETVGAGHQAAAGGEGEGQHGEAGGAQGGPVRDEAGTGTERQQTE